ncbi:hypothetical protein BK648_01640 [Pseudomonas poae]|uniref:MYND finger n=1 Tax=Pseudomonas poae TaxID=200451 RepID=A0A423FI13_9PSED|nr:MULTISPECIES: PP0621 family protein [Pseudomonas]ROM57507.1 hypothetical protein BK648_01640 [Pseudomonas poae]TFF10156.1 hypothetical protein EXW70_14195 [Pseudomonas sp. JMN1]TFF12298.1 hypothetical protein EXW71_11945 [Pseudomonas sp. BCA17]TFF25825.1 hypothetical protein EXW73_15355 [Pseudomonas sp. BCA13]TFF29074.1 hypothetical protein EXW72_12695 [Pseudomonas sp. BCA14]
MVRLLFWIAVIAAAVWFWRKFKSPTAKQQRSSELDATPMVRCAHCGVHLPQDRALSVRQEWYCTQAHLEQGPKPSQR